MQPGIKKNKSIENIFASKIIVMIGPYIVSIKLNIKVLSSTPKSFENLFISCPLGVVSKKDKELLTCPISISSWIF